jgi:hypothetical protein
MAMYESDVIAATNQAEQQYVKAGKIADVDAQGKEHDLGALHTTGPEVDRARKIVDRLLPSYIDPKSVRVYVVDNKEWNAMAMANYSIYVFSGIMKDLDDDEMAIVLGHELTHATYEHSRRQASKGMYTGIAGMAASVGLSQVKSGIVKDAASTAASVGLTTFGNVYSRDYEGPGGPRRPSLRVRGRVRLQEGARALAPLCREVRRRQPHREFLLRRPLAQQQARGGAREGDQEQLLQSVQGSADEERR